MTDKCRTLGLRLTFLLCSPVLHQSSMAIGSQSPLYINCVAIHMCAWNCSDPIYLVYTLAVGDVDITEMSEIYGSSKCLPTCSDTFIISNSNYDTAASINCDF